MQLERICDHVTYICNPANVKKKTRTGMTRVWEWDPTLLSLNSECGLLFGRR